MKVLPPDTHEFARKADLYDGFWRFLEHLEDDIEIVLPP
jgi:hypothetical protein